MGVILTSGPMRYHRLEEGGYELVEDWWCWSRLIAGWAARLDNGTAEQSQGGTLTLRKGFKCDGPSGPTIDTPDFMEGAFAHDAGARMCRASKLPWRAWKPRYDALLLGICKQKGMGWLRRAYIALALRFFGWGAFKPQPSVESVTLVAP